MTDRTTPLSEKDYEKTWREFWVPIVAPTGALNLDQVKRELHDFRTLMWNVSIVYDELADLSKPLTDPRAVICEAREKQHREADEACDDGECKCAIARLATGEK